MTSFFIFRSPFSILDMPVSFGIAVLEEGIGRSLSLSSRLPKSGNRDRSPNKENGGLGSAHLPRPIPHDLQGDGVGSSLIRTSDTVVI